MVDFDTSHKCMGGHGQDSLECIFAKKMILPMYFERQFLYIKFFNHLESGFMKSKLFNNGVVRLRGAKMKMREMLETSKYSIVLSNQKNLNMIFLGIFKGTILNIKATK
jgi:hypothetical protein